MECTEVPGGVKIRTIDKIGYAYLGVVDVTDKAQVAEASKVEIKYLIWHEESYKGGGNYGKFGGYDVSLIKLKDKVSQKPACLPGPEFQDAGIGPSYGTDMTAHLAGFGNYHRTDKMKRTICMTNGHGESKYHYCAGQGDNLCNKQDPPPQAKICQDFQNAPLIHNVTKYNDVAVVTNEGQFFCYPQPQNLKYVGGWCIVKQSALEINQLR